MGVDKVRTAFLLGEAAGVTESISKYDRSPAAKDATAASWNAVSATLILATLNAAYDKFTIDEFAMIFDLVQAAREA